MKLKAKTHKGKNKLREAGTDEWTSTKALASVSCLGGEPGMLIKPTLEDGVFAISKSRWIKLKDDPDFEILES